MHKTAYSLGGFCVEIVQYFISGTVYTLMPLLYMVGLAHDAHVLEKERPNT